MWLPALCTVTELKDKWSLLKRATAKKKDDMKKTGGGKGIPTPLYDDAVVAILGDNTTVVDGIQSKSISSHFKI